MKKTLSFILSLVLLLSCSKSNREEEIVNPGGDGGGTYEGIYFETETGVIDAHEYILNVPGVGGEYDFKLLGVREFKDEGCSSGFVDATITESSARPDENKYYKAKLHLTVHENMTDQDRSMELTIYSLTLSNRAKITITQEKGF